MRWSHAGAQQVASLRALHRSSRWDAFWRTQPQRRLRTLPDPQQAPAPDTARGAPRSRPSANLAHPGRRQALVARPYLARSSLLPQTFYLVDQSRTIFRCALGYAPEPGATPLLHSSNLL